MPSYSVRLANGKQLNTVGTVELYVKFGSFHYFGTFHVLQCEVPLILGMQFFTKVKPEIKWGSRTVYVKRKGQRVQLPCVVMTKKKSIIQDQKPVEDNNMFKGLSVEDSNDHSVGEKVTSNEVFCDKSKVGEQQRRLDDFGEVAQVAQPVSEAQKGRNRSFVGIGKGKKRRSHVAQRAVDKRFISNQLDTISEVSEESVSEDNCTAEMVPIKQFIRGGKCKQYLHFGIVYLQKDSEIDATHENDKQLNFTHRAAHGSGDDADVAHGELQVLAKKSLDQLKQTYPEVFVEPVYPVDRSQCPTTFEHKIPLIDETAAPPKRKLYPLDSVELAELKQQIQLFLDTNRIEPANGPYGAPILFAKKKDGGLRMCIDYRMLNQQTVNDVFPLPRIDGLLQCLDGSEVFSKLDMRDGYHQIPMNERDKVKTSFSCRYGTYQFTVMPFGLMSAPSTFQRMMNTIFFDLLDHGVLCYLDDLLIYSKTVEEHKVLLNKVFHLLSQHKLYIKESKCHLFLEKVNFLGHVVDRNGVSLESGKVDAVRNWPIPTSVNQVQQFLGLCNYYRRFVLRFSELAGPLTLLTRKGQQFVWEDSQQKAFEALKNCLCNAPVLKIFDPALPTRVVCDASNFCVGAVLEQMDSAGKWHPVEYFSKRLSSAERNYSATDREFVAIKLSLERWRQFLISINFLLLTDHAALTYLQSTASVSRRNARWLDFLSQFRFQIEHIKGKSNIVADSLSRIPGTEDLDTIYLCSLGYTLGIQHVNDVPDKLVGISNLLNLSNVITIHENKTFLQQLRDEQDHSNDRWFLRKVELAKGSSLVYQYRNGLLCKLVDDYFCPIIPSSTSRSVQVVLSDLHASALGGHFGATKLIKLAKKRFCWQNMFKSVQNFVRACPVCQQSKHSTQKQAGLLQPLENPELPFQHVSMDFITHLPLCQGNDMIFTVVDRFSRLVRFIPCNSSITAVDCARIFFDNWVCKFGMPQKIISDRDVKFQSKFWSELCKLLDCRVAMSTAYHPQTDGLTERYHRSIEQVLRCYCSFQQSEWISYLSQCEYSLNSTHQDAINDIPLRVITGFAPSLPIDKSLDTLQLPSVQDFVSARVSVQTQVKEALESSRKRMAGLINQKRREMSYAVGQLVWLSTRNLPLRVGSRKLASLWAGPYRVLAEVAPCAYRLDLPDAWRIHDVFHISQLKATHGHIELREPIQLEQQEEFEVEAILQKRLRFGKPEYLVSWKGYASFEDSWEPLDNLANCKALLQQFERSLKHPE